MSEPAARRAGPPSPALTRLLFASLPFLAALGPLLSLHGGVFGFRIACAGITGYAVVFLMARSRWCVADVWLALALGSVVVTGSLGLAGATAGADNPLSEFGTIVLGMSTALAVRAWQRRVPGIYAALARGWVVAGLLSCLIAVTEVRTGRHLPGYLEAAAPQPAATFGNPNALAIFLVMSCVWSIAVRRSGGPGWRLASWVLVFAAYPVLFLAGARLAMGLWALLLVWSVWQGLRRSTHGLVGLAEALAPLVAAVGALLVLPRLLVLAEEFSSQESSGSVREALTRYGLEIAVDQRGLPAGPGTFEPLIAARADPERTLGLVNAHNIWVEILVQYGAVTLVLLVGWMVASALSPPRTRPEAWIAVGVLVTAGMIDSSLLDDSSLWAFVITLGALVRTSRARPGVRPGVCPRPRPHQAVRP